METEYKHVFGQSQRQPLMNRCIIDDERDCATVDLLLSSFAEDAMFVRWVHEQEVRFFFFLSLPRVQSGREATAYAASSGAQRDPTCAFQEMQGICWSALAARGGRFCAPSTKSRLWIPSGASASVRLAKCWFLSASVTHFCREEYSISGVHTSGRRLRGTDSARR